MEPQVLVDPMPHPEVMPEVQESAEEQQHQEQQPEAQPTLVKLPSNVVTLPQMPKPEQGSGSFMFDRPTVRVVALYMLPSGYECASILSENFSKALGALLSAYVSSVVPDVQVRALGCSPQRPGTQAAGAGPVACRPWCPQHRSHRSFDTRVQLLTAALLLLAAGELHGCAGLQRAQGTAAGGHHPAADQGHHAVHQA